MGVTSKPILEDIQYAISRDRQGIQLRVSAVWVTFVEEIIPDGVMAGMTGHRPVRSEHETVYDLHPGQARALRDQLDAALFGLDES